MYIIQGKEHNVITCDCDTKFVYDVSDIGMRGVYSYSFYVTCPKCNHEHVLELDSQTEASVERYIADARSCLACKNLSVVKSGYSSWTVTDIVIDCMQKKNSRFPLNGVETKGEKDYAYSYAEKCNAYCPGKRYEKEVEESEADALARWNNSY